MFSFFCPNRSGALSIEIDPCRSLNYTSINLTRNPSFKKSIVDFKTIKSHLDLPATFTDGFNPFSPYIMASIGLKDVYSIEYFKSITNELNFYSKNILNLQGFLIFTKKAQRTIDCVEIFIA
ncbi:hypothetical protein RF240_18360 [Dickeya dadantii]|uniref:hypothetical protein n=1 Tax=Dickeya dadantii TaxID=204038 RepID=UPI0035A89342